MALFSKLFPGRPEIELRTFDPEDNSILFACAKPLQAGEYDVLAQVGGHKMRCKISVDSIQAGLYFGQFLEPKAALQHLGVLLPIPLHRQEKRSAKRIERGLRVSSQKIPRYVAISSDFSASGIKLKTEGAMRIDDEFEAQIEFDDENMSRLNVFCKVVWCKSEEDKYLVGVAFVDLPKPAAARIAYFVKDLSKVEPGVVSAIYQFD